MARESRSIIPRGARGKKDGCLGLPRKDRSGWKRLVSYVTWPPGVCTRDNDERKLMKIYQKAVIGIRNTTYQLNVSAEVKNVYKSTGVLIGKATSQKN